jgi:hypothetical protein
MVSMVLLRTIQSDDAHRIHVVYPDVPSELILIHHVGDMESSTVGDSANWSSAANIRHWDLGV